MDYLSGTLAIVMFFVVLYFVFIALAALLHIIIMRMLGIKRG